MIVGFTGTRKGMTPHQHQGVVTVLTLLGGGVKIGLHGDAIGADAEFDQICRTLDIPTYCLPADHKDRAHTGAPALAEPMEPLHRNKIIVDTSAVMLACPATKEEGKSGTWATIREARKQRLPMIVFDP